MHTPSRRDLPISLITLIVAAVFCLPACDKPGSLSEEEQSTTSEPLKRPQDKTAKSTSKESKNPVSKYKPAPQKEPVPKKQNDRRKPSLTELPVDNPPSLPVDRQITDSAGRKLDVTITARYKLEIAVVRKKDSKAFDLPIDKLSDEDIAFVLAFPISRKLPKADTYVAGRQNIIEQYEKDILRLRKEVASGRLTTSQMRSKVKEQQKLDKKIAERKKEIRVHRQQIREKQQ